MTRIYCIGELRIFHKEMGAQHGFLYMVFNNLCTKSLQMEKVVSSIYLLYSCYVSLFSHLQIQFNITNQFDLAITSQW